MNTIVIYPGRFHPFHRGHKASYDALVKQFGEGNVYVVSSDLTAPLTSPFSFADKRQMMSKLGIPSDKIVQVKNPYQAHEITRSVADPENTRLIFAVSAKDMLGDDARFKFGMKKDGTPSYMQPLPDDIKKAQPMTKHSYVAVTPTVNFKVRGKDANSASEIRKEYIAGNDADRDGIIVDLYGEAYPEIRDLFDRKLGTVDQTQQVVREASIKNPARAVQLLETIKRLETAAHHLNEVSAKTLANYTKKAMADKSTRIPYDLMRMQDVEKNRRQWTNREKGINQALNKLGADTDADNDIVEDYIEEKWSKKYKDSINCSNPKGFSQRAHCAGRKKKVNESSGYSLAGSFTRDLTMSKVWLLDELAKIAPTVGTVYILGSWYGNLALYMTLQPTVKYTNIINVEQDQTMLDQSRRMLDSVGADNVEYMNKDANDLDYRQLGPAGVVINCSLTDMDGTDWFKHIPDGTLVVMQARDHDPGYQFASPDDIIDKFPLDQVYYTGTRSLQDPETRYNRFMVIGRK
jgi:hypothetical protein